MGWFDERFDYKEGRLHIACKFCERSMWFPPSKHGKYTTCGDQCRLSLNLSIKNSRSRKCESCQSEFIPRSTQLKSGGGRFCSVSCAEPIRQLGRTITAAAKRGSARKEAYRNGTWEPLRGDANPRWRGGVEAYKLRQAKKDPVARRAARREYLRKNPEKAREWSKKRHDRMIGKLPRGTVKKIMKLQKFRCAICECDISKEFHVDHIMPLALGGEHAPTNIQILCPGCNLKKSAKHPVDFMWQLGRLI